MNASSSGAASGAIGKIKSNWLNSQPKHLIILTSAGKLVFSFHDDVDKTMLAISALIRALSSKVDDKLEMVSGSNGFRMIFLKKGDLLLVCTVHQPQEEQIDSFVEEHHEFLKNQLDMLYLHVIFHVTKPALENILSKSAAYDLASLLGGTDTEARNLVRFAETELAVVLNSIPVMPMAWEQRLQALQALELARDSLAAYGFLVTKNGELIAGCGPKTKKTKFGPMLKSGRDYMLLANFVQSTPQLSSTEMWTPLCMAEFDPSGHFQIYCASVTEDIFIILLTTEINLDTFHEASKRRNDMKANITLWDSIKLNKMSPSELVGNSSTGSNNLLHVAVKSTIKGDPPQYVESKVNATGASPIDLTTETQRRYLVKRYASVHFGLGEGKYVFHAATRDICVIVKENDLEMLAVFNPLTADTEIVETFTKLKANVTKWKSPFFCVTSSY